MRALVSSLVLLGCTPAVAGTKGGGSSNAESGYVEPDLNKPTKNNNDDGNDGYVETHEIGTNGYVDLSNQTSSTNNPALANPLEDENAEKTLLDELNDLLLKTDKTKLIQAASDFLKAAENDPEAKLKFQLAAVRCHMINGNTLSSSDSCKKALEILYKVFQTPQAPAPPMELGRNYFTDTLAIDGCNEVPDPARLGGSGMCRVLAIHLMENLELGPEGRLAFIAGEIFRRGCNDRIYAAQAYRAGIQQGDKTGRCLKALQELKLKKDPLYAAIRPVNPLYLGDLVNSLVYQEERQSSPILWNGIEGFVRKISNMEGATSQNKDPKTATDATIKEFKDKVEKSMAASFTDYRALYLQTLLHILMKDRTANYEEVADYAKKKKLFVNLTDFNDSEIPAINELPWVTYFKELIVTKYLKSDAERAPMLLSCRNGKLFRNNTAFDTTRMKTAFSGEGFAIYTMSPDGEIFSESHTVSLFHHSSFLGGADAAGAGEIQVKDGMIISISNKSGHYQSGVIQLVQTLICLRAMGIELKPIKVKVWGEVSVAQSSTDTSIKAEGREWTNGNADSFLRLWEDRPKFTKAFRDLGFVNDPYAVQP